MNMEDALRVSARCAILAELLIENEAELARQMGVSPENITAESLQDTAIMAIQDAINRINHVEHREDEE